MPAKLTIVKVASGQPLSLSQLVAKGDAICGPYNTQAEALTVSKASELPRVLPQTAAYARSEVTHLAKLVPPASAARDWQRFLDGYLLWGEDAARLAEQGSLGDYITRSPVATAAFAAYKHAVDTAKRMGFKRC